MMRSLPNVKKAVTNESGIALVVVLAAVVILSILGLSILSMAATNVKQSTVAREYESTFYVAEAGVNYAINEIKSQVWDVYNSDLSTSEEFFTAVKTAIEGISLDSLAFDDSFEKSPTVDLQIKEPVTSTDHSQKYKIISKGVIGQRSRTVEREITIKWVPKIPYTTGVFTEQTIELLGSSSIVGKTGTNSSAPSSIKLLGAASITGEIFAGPGATNNVVEHQQVNNGNGNKNDHPIRQTYTVTPLDEIQVLDMPNFPRFPTNLEESDLDLTQHLINLTEKVTYVPDLTITSRDLTINVNDRDRILIVNNLQIDQGSITVTGTGSLSVYVANTITLTKNSSLNPNGAPENLHLFVKGNDIIDLKGVTFNGSLFAEKANIEFGAQTSVNGTIITGGSEITSTSNAVSVQTATIYAPNAHFDLQSGLFKGSIIGKSLIANGNTTIIHEQSETTFPFLPGKTIDSLVLLPDSIKEIY